MAPVLSFCASGVKWKTTKKGMNVMKVSLGLTTWSEHPALIDGAHRPVKLSEYAQYLPTVEVDTSFYAIPRQTTVIKWLAEVPANFQFIMKANRAMTKHLNGFADQQPPLADVFAQYREAIAPLTAAGQLKTILFQFPPYFTAVPANIDYLQTVRRLMGSLPIAVDFRHASWLAHGVAGPTAAFCRDMGFTLVAADEPHTTATSIPFYLRTTSPALAMIRLHGRNVTGWNHPGKEWRQRRTLYRYSKQELTGLAKLIQNLTPQPEEITVIFNNNSARDAAPNALQLQKIMGLHFEGLNKRPPKQLSLF